MSLPRLIECGNHQFAPWALTCTHVMSGTAADVVPIRCEEGREAEFDWLCPECYRKYWLGNNDWTTGDLALVCIHCLRKIMKPYRRQMRRKLRRRAAP